MNLRIIKLILIISFFNILTIRATSTSEFFQKVDNFLKTTVEEGLVNYTSITANSDELASLVSFIDDADVDIFTKEEEIAFWVNAYNILVIKTVIDNYPITSPMQVPGFFDKVKQKIAGKELTLNQIEIEVLFEKYPDSRYHFVLVCGALGCPRIASFAYFPENLEDQLNSQTIKAMDNQEFIHVDQSTETVEISEIFRWYTNHFTEDGKSIREYINGYRTEKIPETYKTGYYSYNWNLNQVEAPLSAKPSEAANLQDYTPSSLFDKGQWELKLFQNLYTQNKSFDASGKKVDNDSRQTWFTGINQFTYGINNRINVGVDMWWKSVVYGDPGSSPLEVLRFKNNANHRTAITAVGPKIKLAPIKGNKFFSVQSSFLFPTATDMEGREPETESKVFLSHDRYLWLTQFYYDRPIGSSSSLFFQFAPWVSIPRNSYQENTALETPLSVFYNYYPSTRWTIYLQTEYWPSHYNSNAGEQKFKAFNDYFIQSGGGLKYQVIPGLLELELLYTNFWIGSEGKGAGQTFNFGVRIIR